jgi:ATP:ADP antiporter, AAA family
MFGRRFFTLFTLCFLISVNYFLLRIVKDTLMITGGSEGAAVIPFLKTWAVMPAAFMMAPLLSFLFRKMPRSRVLLVVLGSFLAFFALFGAVLHPLGDRIYLNVSGPVAFSMVRYWPITLFYVMAELWKIAILMVLFWGYVNGTTPMSEAKRLYGPLMLALSLAAVVGGWLTSWASSLQSWETTLSGLMVAVVGVGLVTLVWLHRLHVRHPFETGRRHVALDEAVTMPEQPSTFMDTVRNVAGSKILVCLAVLIFADYVAFNIVEVLWKDRLYHQFPNPADFAGYTARLTFWTGILTGVGALFLTGNVLKRWGWTSAAMVTPVVLMLTSVGFFIFVFGDLSGLAVGVGALHSALCRAAKQSFSDPAKEMGYIPLSPALQMHGKAFVDGICPTLGKSVGALLQQGLLLFCPTLAATTPYCAVVVVVMLLLTFGAAIVAGAELRQRELATA